MLGLDHEACERLEAELRRPDGVTTILVVGGRCSGKTTVCETVIRRMNRHLVRWTPYEEFVAGHVSQTYSGLDTIVFVDDADVLVRLTKGSSVSLMDAMEAYKHRPQIRIVMTALNTKGRVWRSVASRVGIILEISPHITHSHGTVQGTSHVSERGKGGRGRGRGRGQATGERDAWVSVLLATNRAVDARLMRNWCDARDMDENDGGKTGELEEDSAFRQNQDAHGEEDMDTESESCVIRKIAHILLHST